MSNVVNDEWDKMSNRKKCQLENSVEYNKRRMGHNVKFSM